METRAEPAYSSHTAPISTQEVMRTMHTAVDQRRLPSTTPASPLSPINTQLTFRLTNIQPWETAKLSIPTAPSRPTQGIYIKESLFHVPAKYTCRA